MATRIASDRLAVTVGRHTRLAVPFRWTVAGQPVDLEADGYTVRVWVTPPGPGPTSGPHVCTVEGDTATYQLAATDLEAPSPDAQGNAKIVAVAENATTTLVSRAREIPVGDWGGADGYQPAP